MMELRYKNYGSVFPHRSFYRVNLTTIVELQWCMRGPSLCVTERPSDGARSRAPADYRPYGAPALSSDIFGSGMEILSGVIDVDFPLPPSPPLPPLDALC